jgi:hypothetical protein
MCTGILTEFSNRISLTREHENDSTFYHSIQSHHRNVIGAVRAKVVR